MSTAAWRGEQLTLRFHDVHEVLLRHASLWRPQAFQEPILPWEQHLPALSARLRGLEYARAEALAEDETALASFLDDDLPDLAALNVALSLPASTAPSLPPLPEAPGVPGRKWRQIKAFAACVPASAGPLVEWCAGKAHLGRLLSRLQQREVTALEWDARLAADGAALARRENLPIHFHCVDVLEPAALALLQCGQDVVALHACGELHLQLLRGCAERLPRSLALAPCCYQLIAAERYRPLSRAAQAADLQLTLHDLHTAVRDSVTSPARVREQRRTLQAWRLGFDYWQRTVSGVDRYLPTPSLPLSVLQRGFEHFCREMAARNGLEAAAADVAPFEAAGWRRLREVAALDLARIAFRRALEMWLVLDRALYLHEHGYEVELGTFCARELTPRNVLIRARRRAER